MNTQVLDARRDADGGYRVDVSRGERVGRVSSEWFSRPADQRYLSLNELARTVRDRTDRSRTRVVVFHAITQELKGGYYGILTQGFPQLVRVNADVLGLETEQPLPTNFPALCRARMIHEYPVIPDVERLEKMIADLPLPV